MILYLAGNGGAERNGPVAHKLMAMRLLFPTLLSYHHFNVPILNLYLAGADNTHWIKALNESTARSVLASYFSIKEQNSNPGNFFAHKINAPNLFIDSGAYSAWRKQIVIDIDEYCDFLHKYQDKITIYAGLDVIGDSDMTMKHQRYMEDKGLKPIPTFHHGSDFGLLREIVKEYPYIALGNMVPLSRDKPQLAEWLDQVFSIIGPGIKVHGFGMTNPGFILRYPFYSVDSTTWLGGSMRAEVHTFQGAKGMKVTYSKMENKATLDSIKLTDDGGQKRWFQRVTNNAIEWQKFGDFATRVWEERGIIWK